MHWWSCMDGVFWLMEEWKEYTSFMGSDVRATVSCNIDTKPSSFSVSTLSYLKLYFEPLYDWI